jgi:hypothetical protein
MIELWSVSMVAALSEVDCYYLVNVVQLLLLLALVNLFLGQWLVAFVCILNP